MYSAITTIMILFLIFVVTIIIYNVIIGCIAYYLKLENNLFKAIKKAFKNF
jgi:uncharacterized protein YxeA